METNSTGRCSFDMNGEKVDLLFGMPACERYYLDLSEGRIITDENGNVKSTTGIACLLYAGYWNNSVYKSLPIVHSVGTFLDFLEENVENDKVTEQMIAMGNCFKGSVSVIKYLQRKSNELEEQKKTINQFLNAPKQPEGTGN